MFEAEKVIKGYVYILEVKDIDLPVCKIGMTKRTPYERCDEINKSSTGDFIWKVAHYISVDNCHKLESLVHSKLMPLRQKGREFFNLTADDANAALISILNNQDEIKKVGFDDISSDSRNFESRSIKNKRTFSRVDSEYTELLQLFSSLLNVKGRPFGQLNKPIFGMSDGNEGVQWNLSVSKDTGDIKLGVNLEGMKYAGWPITKFILSELESQSLDKLKKRLTDPDKIFIRFTRDAWQVTARPSIVEKYLGGKEVSISECSSDQWVSTLSEALTCLNSDMNYCGRAKQKVTLANKPKKGDMTRVMEVSPHLTIWSPLSLCGDMQENLQKRIVDLRPVYNWVKAISQS